MIPIFGKSFISSRYCCDHQIFQSLYKHSAEPHVTSTWGEGKPPDDAEEFCFLLYDGEVGGLPDLEFAVCALGDTSYDDFCGCGRRVEEALLKAGARKLIDRVDLDIDYEDDYEAWAEQLAERLNASA